MSETKGIIIDGHLDIAWNKVGLNRNFFESALSKRDTKRYPNDHSEGSSLVGFPELEIANIRVVFATIWTQSVTSNCPAPGPKFTTDAEAFEQTMEQLRYYEHLAKNKKITLISNRDDLQEVLNSSEYRLGLVLLMEGADSISSLLRLRDLAENGIRIIGPIWQTNNLGGDTESGLPLTDKGRDFLKEMEKYHFILDVAHMSDQGAIESMERFGGLVINSHSNCRSIVEGSRQISDYLITQIALKKGVVGIMPWAPKIIPNWNNTITKNEFKLSQVADHIVHICQLTDSTDYVGIGSSFDGGFGVEQTPVEVDTSADLQKLAQILSERSFSQEDISNIMHRNWKRVLCAGLK